MIERFAVIALLLAACQDVTVEPSSMDQVGASGGSDTAAEPVGGNGSRDVCDDTILCARGLCVQASKSYRWCSESYELECMGRNVAGRCGEIILEKCWTRDFCGVAVWDECIASECQLAVGSSPERCEEQWASFESPCI